MEPTLMKFHSAEHASRVLLSLFEQQINGQQCDVILRSSSAQFFNDQSVHDIPAHRCVLAANSDYFRALFDCGLADSSSKRLVVSSSSPEALRHVIRFMYSGDVTIDAVCVEDVLRLADYLGVGKLLDFCGTFLANNLTDKTCLKTKVLVDTYSLKALAAAVTTYIAPRWACLIKGDEIASMSRESLLDLLRPHGSTGFARELDVFDAVVRWANKQLEATKHQALRASEHCQPLNEPSEDSMDDVTAEREQILNAYDLLRCVEFGYLTKDSLRKVLSLPDVVYWLTARQPDTLTAIRDILSDAHHSVRDTCDVIFVRSRNPMAGQAVQILVYVIEVDEWRILNPSVESGTAPGAAGLCGLESMVIYSDYLYCLCSRTEDMHGYMHKARETKVMYRVAIAPSAAGAVGHGREALGAVMGQGREALGVVGQGREELGAVMGQGWEALTPPPSVRGKSRLVATVHGLFAVDRTGCMDEYCARDNAWRMVCCGAEGSQGSMFGTLYFLPMPADRAIYFLRTFSSGYSFDYAQKSFAIYRFEEANAHWARVTEVEASEVFATSIRATDEDSNFYGYSVSPGRLTLTDELGHPRAAFQLTTDTWSSIEPRVVRPPCFHRAVYGSAAVGSKVYCVGRSMLDRDGENVFWMYDNIRGRFKLLSQPPLCPSGLMCTANVDRSVLAVIAST